MNNSASFLLPNDYDINDMNNIHALVVYAANQRMLLNEQNRKLI